MPGMATTFQRARSDEQRALRRQTILETAAAMLAEMPVADVSLNELSRRVGLAKSNVLRYFDSREDVLLELLSMQLREWIAHLGAAVPAAVSRRAGYPRRAAQLAHVIAASIVERPVLCDLMSAQSAVLEHNVSVAAYVQHKLAGIQDAEAIIALVNAALPELSPADARKYVIALWLTTAALWAYGRPAAEVLEAYAADERLADMHLDFAEGVEDYLITCAMGLHARAGR